MSDETPDEREAKEGKVAYRPPQSCPRRALEPRQQAQKHGKRVSRVYTLSRTHTQKDRPTPETGADTIVAFSK